MFHLMPSEDEWAEADITADQALGKPLARTPEQGLADMQRRITSLQRRLAQASPGTGEALRLDLAEAQARLKEYQAQLDGRN